MEHPAQVMEMSLGCRARTFAEDVRVTASCTDSTPLTRRSTAACAGVHSAASAFVSSTCTGTQGHNKSKRVALQGVATGG